jgi:flavorubredoxin
MKCFKDGIYNVGVNDKKIDLFEGLYSVPNGVAYNSYVICDEKIAVMDAVAQEFGDEWLGNIQKVLGDRQPDYLVVHHMEHDHSANIVNLVNKYPNIAVVGNTKTFVMLEEYFGNGFPANRVVVADGEKLSLGKHELTFIFAPMVHWPEVMVSYDELTKTLFSADAFGKFGARDVEDNWVDEARRYYIGIVGKYGVQVQALLKKLAFYGVECIAPLHGPVLCCDIDKYINLYYKWSGYVPEEEGVFIAFTSIYGHTKDAAYRLKEKLESKGITVEIADLARVDQSLCVANAFKYSKLVLATTTYNGEIFPKMREFIDKLVERNYQKRTIALIENGTWAPVAANQMKAKFEKCKNLTFCENSVKIRASLNSENESQLNAVAYELSK